MSWLQILMLIRKLDIRALLDYPTDLRNVEGVRLWLVAVSDALDTLADFTDTVIDDQLIGYLKTVVNDAEMFSSLYDIVLMIVDGKEDAKVRTDVYIFSDQYSFDPTIIFTIIQVIVMIVNCIKKRRNG